jgi:hypothetical protein
MRSEGANSGWLFEAIWGHLYPRASTISPRHLCTQESCLLKFYIGSLFVCCGAFGSGTTFCAGGDRLASQLTRSPLCGARYAAEWFQTGKGSPDRYVEIQG